MNVTRCTVLCTEIGRRLLFFKGTVLLRRCGVDEKQSQLEEEQLWWRKLL